MMSELALNPMKSIAEIHSTSFKLKNSGSASKFRDWVAYDDSDR